MADQLYLSLWFPNFRFADLPAAMTGVLRQFARVSGLPRVSAAAAYPVSFTEPPVYQRVYVLDQRAEDSADTSASIIESAVAEAMELLHEDTAYEFEMQWRLWTPEGGDEGFDVVWKQQPFTVKFLGFGPDFDNSTFEQSGQIRVDFGLDTPWVFDDDGMDDNGDDDTGNGGNETSGAYADEEARGEAARRIQQNVEMLLAFTLSVEKHCGISSRLLWTESGEPLAEKLIARLQRLN